MATVVHRRLLLLALFVLAGCGTEAPQHAKLDDDQAQLVRSLKLALKAKGAAWATAVREARRLRAISNEAWQPVKSAREEYVELRRAERRLHSEAQRKRLEMARRGLTRAQQRYDVAADSLREAGHRCVSLRCDINELQLEIQRIEGFWEPDPHIKALKDTRRGST